jgi:hypothetical protein
MPAAGYSAIACTGNFRVFAASGERSASRGISSCARARTARSSSGSPPSSPEREAGPQPFIRQPPDTRRSALFMICHAGRAHWRRNQSEGRSDPSRNRSLLKEPFAEARCGDRR